MAVTNFGGYETGNERAYARVRYETPRNASGRGQRFTNMAGAAISLGLMAGAVIWAYQIAVRDVSGVPVVQALDGPMRIAPENPGGEEAEHQGLSVNTVAAAGSAAPVADELVLAPRPVDLTMEDGPGLSSETPVVTNAPADAPNAVRLAEEMAAATGPEVLVEAALSEALDAGPGPAAPPTVTVAADPALAGMRPMPRPGGTPAAETVLETVAVTSVPDAPELDPATIKAGTRLVQLGTFDDVEAARAEWLRLAGAFGPLMAGKARIVEPADSGVGAFVRLRAQGFDDLAAARGFCATVLASQPDNICIPVTVR